MDRIDLLREKLHAAIDKANAIEVLKISEELDIELVKYMVANIMLSDKLQVINDTN